MVTAQKKLMERRLPNRKGEKAMNLSEKFLEIINQTPTEEKAAKALKECNRQFIDGLRDFWDVYREFDSALSKREELNSLELVLTARAVAEKRK